MTYLRGIALLVAFSVPALLTAQERAPEDSFSRAYTACIEKSGGVTVAMLDCGSAEYAKLDAALNAAYRAATNALEPEQRKDRKSVV